MKFRIPRKERKFLIKCTTNSFSGRILFRGVNWSLNVKKNSINVLFHINNKSDDIFKYYDTNFFNISQLNRYTFTVIEIKKNRYNPDEILIQNTISHDRFKTVYLYSTLFSLL
jgi:hypothetical protein